MLPATWKRWHSHLCLSQLNPMVDLDGCKLAHDCQPVSHSRPRHLQSSDSLTCVVRRAHNTYGDRCFATAGPRVWNSLPIELQQCDSLGRLSEDFSLWVVELRRFVTFCKIAPYINSLTYLPLLTYQGGHPFQYKLDLTQSNLLMW